MLHSDWLRYFRYTIIDNIELTLIPHGIYVMCRKVLMKSQWGTHITEILDFWMEFLLQCGCDLDGANISTNSSSYKSNISRAYAPYNPNSNYANHSTSTSMSCHRSWLGSFTLCLTCRLRWWWCHHSVSVNLSNIYFALPIACYISRYYGTGAKIPVYHEKDTKK